MKKEASKRRDMFILKRCFKNFKKEPFIQDLLNQKWDSPTLADPSVSVHEKAALFDSIFEACLDKHAPIKKLKVHKTTI